MDRKKIILSAIAINAGLLILLFFTALHREEEKLNAPLVTHPPYVFESPGSAETSPSIPLIEPMAVATEPEIVHKLPPPILAHPPASTPPAVSEPTSAEVVVKKGDTLDKIAKAHHVTIDELLRFNQLQSTFLRPGQMLKIPASVKEQRPASNDPDYYVVKVGDTPWMIAHKHHIKVEELLKMNHLNSEKAKRLKPGDRLRVR